MDKQITANSKSLRNSNIEIVRILAMLMIIFSHLYATNSGENYTGVQLIIFEFAISVFHSGLGVVLFMVISGYFLIRYSQKKLTQLLAITWSCSAFALVIEFVLSRFGIGSCSLSHAIHRLTPITSKYYWYVSCYAFLMILSPFINKAIDKLKKRDFTNLVIILLVLFYVLPTFLYTDIMGDRGKGLITMVCSYFIGAYIAKYNIQISKKKAIIGAIGLSIFTFAGNMAATLVRGEASYPFSRECSLTTIVIAVLIILAASKEEYYNKVVNSLASRGIYIYMLGCFTTGIISKFEVIINLTDKLWLLPFSLILSIAVFLFAYLLSYVIEYPAKLVDFIITKIWSIIENLLKKICTKFGLKYENFDC
ncbi:MAG: acyltransferase [Eubacterium sp.]|nr:acyltransferase [Eubacterium sp.]